MLFFIIVNSIEEERHIKLYVAAALMTCVIVTLYAYSQIGSVPRLQAPFETPMGGSQDYSTEPGTLGGYYVLIFGVALGFLSEYTGRFIPVLWGFLAFLIPPFFLTLSRASYAAMVPVVAVFMFCARRRRLVVAGIGMVTLAGFLYGSSAIRDTISRRIRATIGQRMEYGSRMVSIFGRDVILEPSTAQRYDNWRRIITKDFPQRPFFGYGVTGVGLVDAQYPRVLGEMGLFGFVLFVWIIVRIFRTAWRYYRQYEQPLARGLCLGLIVALAGILFQAIGTNAFIIVRSMEPFWLLVALVMSLPHIYPPDTRAHGPEDTAGKAAV